MSFVREFRQDRRVRTRPRGCLLLDGEPEFSEEDGAELLVGVDVELLTCRVVDLPFDAAALDAVVRSSGA